MTRAGIFGIVNVTRDSFSDGGRLLPELAIAHGEQLLAQGADVLDLGAQATSPDAESVSASEEIARLRPVARHFVRRGVSVSIDTNKPAVMAALAGEGVQWWNDVDGLRGQEALAVAAALPPTVRLVVMHARGAGGKASRAADGRSPQQVGAAVQAFFSERMRTLTARGIAASRIVLDPGMGFFLSPLPEVSWYVLEQLANLDLHGAELLVSVSRKSFLGPHLPAAERGPATLAAELQAVRGGAHWIRTHDVAALAAALAGG